MLDRWTPPIDNRVVVPFLAALSYLRSLSVGGSFRTEQEVGMMRRPGFWKIIVPASKQKGGQYYLNPDLLRLTQHGQFEKQSSYMVASVSDSYFEALVHLLQDRFSATVSLRRDLYDQLAASLPRRQEPPRIELPPRPDRHPEKQEKELQPELNELPIFYILNFKHYRGLKLEPYNKFESSQ